MPLVPFSLYVFKIQNRLAWGQCMVERIYYKVPQRRVQGIEPLLEYIKRQMDVVGEPLTHRYCTHLSWEAVDDNGVPRGLNEYDFKIVSEAGIEAIFRVLDGFRVRYTLNFLSDASDPYIRNLFVYQIDNRRHPHTCHHRIVCDFFPSSLKKDICHILSEAQEQGRPNAVLLMFDVDPLVYTMHTSSFPALEELFHYEGLENELDN